MSVTIDQPVTSPPTVGRTFDAFGQYDLTDLVEPSEVEVRVECWVTQGETELSRSSFVIEDPATNPTGDWRVTHTLDDDYEDCTVTAQIYVGVNPQPEPASVEGVDVEDPA